MARSTAFSRCAERGTAIILAILTVALVSGIATAVLADYGQAVTHLEGRHNQAQARVLARAASDWARWVLSDDMRGVESRVSDYLGEHWTAPAEKVQVGDGVVAGTLIDQQRFFNINSVLAGGAPNPGQISILERLLGHCNIPADHRSTLLDALVDWVDPDNEPRGREATEHPWYRSQPGRTLPPNVPLLDVEELSQVRGFEDPVLLTCLRPLLTALPPDAINMNPNTASETVLAATLNIPLAEAAGLARLRAADHFNSTSDFITRMGNLSCGSQCNTAALDVVSKHFLLRGSARWAEVSTVRMEALIERTGQDTRLLWLKIL